MQLREVIIIDILPSYIGTAETTTFICCNVADEEGQTSLIISEKEVYDQCNLNMTSERKKIISTYSGQEIPHIP